MLNYIWQEQFRGAWSNELSYKVNWSFHAEIKEQFNSILDELMKTFQKKETIFDNLMDISGNHDKFARYILNDTEGTCGKNSNNPSKQNHASQKSMLVEGCMTIQPSISKLIHVIRECWRKKSGEIKISAMS